MENANTKYILAIDQGTSSTKSIIFDNKGEEVAKATVSLNSNYLENGFVEQSPEGIYENVKESVALCLQDFEEKGFAFSKLVSSGISNQRETFILWDEEGVVLNPAVVWSCKRSIGICQRLIKANQNDLIREKTGLIIDPYFSATKLLWLLENDANLKRKLKKGELFFGTVDTWLLFKFTKGKSFKTDYTNASRTLLFNIHTLSWDTEILKLWGLEKLHLPEVCPSSNEFGMLDLSEIYLAAAHTIPITSLIGDSHAAAFGEGCFEKGMAKATLGTGCSIMMNIGDNPLASSYGMLTTICWSTENRIDYALEGSIVACGSTLEWLKKELNLFKEVSETEKMALAVTDAGGVYLIPAFSGLGAPHWQMERKASIEGLTFGTTKNHIIRAALESVPFQIKDVIDAMEKDLSTPLQFLAINGGLTNNKFVTSFLSDLLSKPLQMQQNADISALGAAFLSGLKSGVYTDLKELQKLNSKRAELIKPAMENSIVMGLYSGWKNRLAKTSQT